MQLHRQPGRHGAPHQVLGEHRVGRPVAHRASGEPPGRRAAHLVRVGRGLVAEGDAQREGGGVLGGGVQGLGGVADERVDRPRGVRDLFGQRFEAYDLMHPAVGRRGQLGGGGEGARGARLQQKRADARAAQQQPGGTVGAQLAAAGEIAHGRAVRLHAQQRRAPAAHGEPGPAVEVRGPRRGRARSRGGGQMRLERAEAQLAVDRAVAVLIDQRRQLHARPGPGHRAGSGAWGLRGTRRLVHRRRLLALRHRRA